MRIFPPSGGEAKTLSLDSLAGREDVRGREYAVGGSTRSVTGFSLEMVIREAGADPYDWGYLEVTRRDGGVVVLDENRSTGASRRGPRS